jgi:hypothetical protein
MIVVVHVELAVPELPDFIAHPAGGAVPAVPIELKSCE